jgi:DeoR family glycerol-3-phosphate regulon repressor
MDVKKVGRNSKPRQTAILLHLQQKGRASVEELAELFNATPQTIRKDLNHMAEDSKIMRFHGGAALLAGSEYTGFEARKEIARNEKDRIGNLAAKKIPNNASVIVNAGTTTAAVARRLNNHVGLKVVTDSVNVANEIREFPGIEVMVPGGLVRRTDGVIFGETAVDFIRQFRADIALIGSAAIARDGSLLDYDLREASVARAIIGSARHVILAADSTKFDRIAPVCIGHMSQVQTLVTDAGCPPELRTLCKAHGVNLFEAR